MTVIIKPMSKENESIETMVLYRAINGKAKNEIAAGTDYIELMINARHHFENKHLDFDFEDTEKLYDYVLGASQDYVIKTELREESI